MVRRVKLGTKEGCGGWEITSTVDKTSAPQPEGVNWEQFGIVAGEQDVSKNKMFSELFCFYMYSEHSLGCNGPLLSCTTAFNYPKYLGSK